MIKINSKGFGAVEVVLIVVLIGLLGVAGWYVWNRNNNQKKLNAISSFAECKADKGSAILESFPEVCLAKNGKRFTNPDQKVVTPKTTNDSAKKVDNTKYLVIKEWGVKIPLSKADDGAYYKLTDLEQSKTNPTNLDVFSTNSDSIVGPAGTSCKGEYIAYLLRLPSNDPKWQPSKSYDDNNVSPLFGDRIVIGKYKYAIATKKQYGPTCFQKTKSGDYDPDDKTATKFGEVVTAFETDFKKITQQ